MLRDAYRMFFDSAGISPADFRDLAGAVSRLSGRGSAAASMYFISGRMKAARKAGSWRGNAFAGAGEEEVFYEKKFIC